MKEYLPEIIITNHQLVNGMFSEADRLIKKKTELTLTQLLILQSSKSDECESQEEIAGILGVSQPAISKQITQLIDKKLVTEIQKDRRSFTISMTSKGKAEFKKAMDIYHSYNQKIFSSINQQEIIEFVRVLQKLIKAYNSNLT